MLQHPRSKTRTLLIALLTGLLFIHKLAAIAQSESPHEMVGQITGYIAERNPKQACRLTLIATQKDSNILNAILDYNVYSHLAFNDSLTTTCKAYLKQLRNAGVPVILRKTQSLQLLLLLMDPKYQSSSDSLLLEMYRLQESVMNNYTRNDIYILKALYHIKNTDAPTPWLTDLMLLSIQRAALRSMPEGAPEAMNARQLEQRARCRFRIREACYLSFLFHHAQTDTVTMHLLGTMNPDRFDRENEFVFEADWVLLHGLNFWNEKATGEIPYGYYDIYITWLLDHHQTEKAYREAAINLYMFPNPSAKKRFENLAPQTGQTEEAADYFHRVFNQMSATFPTMILTEIKGTVDTFPFSGNTWFVGDIWGTWCPPCVAELPEIQHYADSCHSLPYIQFVTFAFQSPDIAAFMEKRGYHLRVYPVDDTFNDLLHIESFPMKIIISPEGKYRLLPYRKDWQTRIRELIPES